LTETDETIPAMTANTLIHVLTERHSLNGWAFHEPLQRNRKRLHERGITLCFFWDDPYATNLPECDILWINSKVFRSWWGSRKEKVLERLDYYRQGTKTVFYFDTDDSAGTIQHDAFDYIARYYKMFLLKDKRLYLRKLYGGRLFTDFYHRHFGVIDTMEITDLLGPLRSETHLAKLALAWSPALSWSRLRSGLAALFISQTMVPPSRPRAIPITCRIGHDYSRETVRYQREQIRRMLQELGVTTAKVSRRRYMNELKKSQIGVSPFGWGEFAYRDYEIITNGGLLFKPDMDHLESWPDIYQAGETYVPFQWDLSDFRTKLECLLDQPAEITRCAEKAQSLLMEYVTGASAQDEFCQRVAAIVQVQESLVNTSGPGCQAGDHAGH
jgi:hypothetical protein